MLKINRFFLGFYIIGKIILEEEFCLVVLVLGIDFLDIYESVKLVVIGFISDGKVE